jgi:hypothetical protein
MGGWPFCPSGLAYPFDRVIPPGIAPHAPGADRAPVRHDHDDAVDQPHGHQTQTDRDAPCVVDAGGHFPSHRQERPPLGLLGLFLRGKMFWAGLSLEEQSLG